MINTITIWDEHDGEDHYILTAKIKENGELLLEGSEIGPRALESHGDEDFEYWYIIKPEWKDTILLRLLAEKFTRSNHPLQWLRDNAIEFEKDSWI